MPPPPTTTTVSADAISKADFYNLVAAYPAVAEAVSESKGTKPGRKTLPQLDSHRYAVAPQTFRRPDGPEMTLADAQTLVEWKLRHGKFRPSLMSLVASNSPNTTKRIIAATIRTYRAHTTPGSPLATQQAITALSALRGVGPATASLLLSVHDPDRAIFFSDEAYWWVCCRGRKDPIRYTAGEYAALCTKAGALRERLGGLVAMLDVERAAYVAMRQGYLLAAVAGTEAEAEDCIEVSTVHESEGKRKRKSGRGRLAGRETGTEVETDTEKDKCIDVVLHDAETGARQQEAEQERCIEVLLQEAERGGGRAGKRKPGRDQASFEGTKTETETELRRSKRRRGQGVTA